MELCQHEPNNIVCYRQYGWMDKFICGYSLKHMLIEK